MVLPLLLIVFRHQLPDNFHQLRASIFASRVGLDARALGCESPWYLAAGYWAREVMALAAAYVRGY